MNSIVKESASIMQLLRRGIAQRQLEGQLSSIIRTVAGHKKNKVPRGDPRYVSLYSNSMAKVNRFCEMYNVPMNEIDSQIPALQELKNLATVPDFRPAWYLTAVGILALGLSVSFLGVVTGIVQYLFNFGYNTFMHLVR